MIWRTTLHVELRLSLVQERRRWCTLVTVEWKLSLASPPSCRFFLGTGSRVYAVDDTPQKT